MRWSCLTRCGLVLLTAMNLFISFVIMDGYSNEALSEGSIAQESPPTTFPLREGEVTCCDEDFTCGKCVIVFLTEELMSRMKDWPGYEMSHPPAEASGRCCPMGTRHRNCREVIFSEQSYQAFIRWLESRKLELIKKGLKTEPVP